MFEDEMLPEHAASTDDEYRRLTEQEIHDEAIAQAQGLNRSLVTMAYAITSQKGTSHG